MQAEPHSGDPESTTAGTGSSSAFTGVGAGAGASSSSVGDYAQLEALLAGRMKTLESELAGLRRDLHESRRLEVQQHCVLYEYAVLAACIRGVEAAA